MKKNSEKKCTSKKIVKKIVKISVPGQSNEKQIVKNSVPGKKKSTVKQSVTGKVIEKNQ